MSIINYKPTESSLGAFIYDFDCTKSHSTDTLDILNKLLLKYQVLIFRNKTPLNDSDFIQFAKCFGTPKPHPRPGFNNPNHPEINYISNDKKYSLGRLGSAYVPFHADLSYMDNSNIGRITILHAIQLKNINENKNDNNVDGCDWGQTIFMNTYQTYNSLDKNIKNKIKDYMAMHRHPRESDNPSKKLVFHKVIKPHSITKKNTLYISPALTRYLKPNDKKLYHYLIKHNTSNQQFMYKHRWKIGDIVVWDNECTLHSRPSFNGKTYKRVMKRTQIWGPNSRTPKIMSKL
eukprot:905359_1